MQETIQVKAIIKSIENGKCKNIYAAKNKIKQLRLQQMISEQKKQYLNYLAQ